MKSNKKGFTIVELVIVVAIIAILAAVLIPTFANIIKMANVSADVQAAKNMNTHLAAAKYLDGLDSILDVYDVFDESGYRVESYKPLADGTAYFYDKQENKILYVEDDGVYKVLYPEELKDETYATLGHDWFSLDMSLTSEAPAGYTEAATVTVDVHNGREYAYIVEEFNKENSQINDLTINVKGTIDLMGSCVTIKNVGENQSIKIIGETSGENITSIIKNAAANISISESKSNEDGALRSYNASAIIGVIQAPSGNDKQCSAEIKNIIFENLSVKDPNAGNVALIVSSVGGYNNYTNDAGSITIDNIEIRNSRVIGHRNVGSLIGIIQGGGQAIFKNNIKLTNVTVQTVGGRSGKIIGYANEKTTTYLTNTDYTFTNCTVDFSTTTLSVYFCERNTGKNYTDDSNTTHDLGLINGEIYSHITENGKEKIKHYSFDSYAEIGNCTLASLGYGG